MIAITPNYSDVLVTIKIFPMNLQFENVIFSYYLLFCFSIDFIKINGKFIEVRFDRTKFDISKSTILNKNIIVVYLASSTEDIQDFEGCKMSNYLITSPENYFIKTFLEFLIVNSGKFKYL